MTDTPRLERPRQVRTASILTVVGSALLVLTLVDTLGSLRSTDMRESVEEALADPPGDGLGITVDGALDALHVVGLVAGALAAAAFVLGIFVLQGHRGARIGLTVVTGLLVLTMPMSGFMPLLLAVAVWLLWSRPVRDWFDGKAPRPAGESPRSRRAVASAAPANGTGPGTSQPLASSSGSGGWQPRPAAGWRPQAPAGGPGPSGGTGTTGPGWQPGWDQGQPSGWGQQPTGWGQQPTGWGDPSPGWGQQAPTGWTGQAPGPGWPAWDDTGRDADRRPATVTWACWLTWVGSGLVALATLLAALYLGASADEAVRDLRDELNLSTREVTTAAWTAIVIVLVWSLSAILLAALTFRRSQAGRVLLVISCVMTVLMSLLMILSIVTGLTLLLAGAALVLLFTGGANDWFARRAPLPGSAGGWDPYSQQAVAAGWGGQDAWGGYAGTPTWAPPPATAPPEAGPPTGVPDWHRDESGQAPPHHESGNPPSPEGAGTGADQQDQPQQPDQQQPDQQQPNQQQPEQQQPEQQQPEQPGQQPGWAPAPWQPPGWSPSPWQSGPDQQPPAAPPREPRQPKKPW